MYEQFTKPILDYSIALVMFLLLSPVILLVSILLAISHRGNPFFLQERPGKDGKIFQIIKFKTMRDLTDVNGKQLSDYERLTLMGKIVRKTSLDEIPQLLNVLKGEMSLVGPRPLLPEYWTLYSEEQRRRHDVKPGITGWAQINGRNALSWEEKFRYDLEYVDKISPRMDAKIVLVTLEKVVKRHGVNANNYMTMEAFKGNVA
ncbi:MULTISPECIES: sugar transferase [Chryseobacterium]|uniref:UDP-galactose phosphate transferase n=1 Tax=Chryseobacterium koreense CCUG 49689 TaxID=1304281 RepID=A0A0J7IZ88_9FLAO|nr:MULTISPECIES: sugar transferase [Chryseobacterium]KMQ71121.1 UDP-galactose phosphate transferase [Chryseobacterium koreense CCUG 49689]MBB5332758.1 lipopolysaccharide/colanic/teichoic acid biosynthesis glycosyltransferase [Chryseobacterium koreense]